MNFKKRVNGSWTDTSHYIHNTSTDAITTLPTVIYPTDTMATVGLKGQTIQSSTPSPTSPVMPEGTGERTGNLYNIDAKNTDNGYINGTQLNKDGTTESWNVCEVTEYIELQPSTSYILSKIGSYNSIAYCIYDANKQYISGENYRGQSVKAIVMPSNGKYLRFSHYKTKIDTMLNEGSTALPYEPYGYKIPISSGDTTTPIYLGEVETTRKIGKLVLDGTENWVSKGNPATFRYENSPIPHTLNNSVCYCSHFKNLPWQQVITTNNSFTVEFTSYPDTINIRCDDYSTVEDFKAFLATQYANGTPVTVWYVLATPTTGIVNEPIRKIGDYADEVSGITIPTIAGANTLSVGTTLQPSEVTVNYKGWHPVADVHEADNGAWT